MDASAIEMMGSMEEDLSSHQGMVDDEDRDDTSLEGGHEFGDDGGKALLKCPVFRLSLLTIYSAGARRDGPGVQAGVLHRLFFSRL